MHSLIAPSLLSANFAKLGEEVSAMQNAGADLIHVDVMDGHFVPNISIGIPVVASLRATTKMLLDVHLMISDPLTYAPRFADAGADLIVFHIESECNPGAVIETIKRKGKRCGISIKPATPAEAVFPYLKELDMVLIMTVEPGFGGQKFMQDMCPKIAEIRKECSRQALPIDIEVDGGISCETIGLAATAGANVFVAGSALFGATDYSLAIDELRRCIQK